LRTILLSLVVSLPISVFAARDTLPLQSKTTPSGKDTSSIVSPKKANEQAAGPAPSGPKPYVASFGVYGTSRLNEASLKEFLGAKNVDVWLKKGLASDPTAVDIEKKFIARIKKKFGFPLVEWSIIQYFEPGALALHLTLDVVEERDVARRMPFMDAPKEELADPGGLLAEWHQYETLAYELVETGQLEPESEKCAALHCPFGHKHEKLKKWEKVFLDGAKKHARALLDVQKRDKRPEYRAAASYVLAYWVAEKKKVVEAMLDRLKDPDAMVRNNALRVLGDIAEFHTDVVVPISPILPILDYPRVSDRSKALYVAYMLAGNSPEVRREITKRVVPNLIALMMSSQPDQKELAHNLLKKISGKDLSGNDPKGWLAWYGSQSSEISNK
jgi:hypothetical protein